MKEEGKDQSFWVLHEISHKAISPHIVPNETRCGLMCTFFSNSLIAEKKKTSKTHPNSHSVMTKPEKPGQVEDLKDEFLSLRWPTKMFCKWQWLRLRCYGARAQAKTKTKSSYGWFSTWEWTLSADVFLATKMRVIFLYFRKSIIKIEHKSLNICWKILILFHFVFIDGTTDNGYL